MIKETSCGAVVYKQINSEFLNIISYFPCEGHIKDVVYFVAKAENDTAMMPRKCEVKGLAWQPFPEARELLTYDLDKQTLEAAYNYLLKG